MIVTAAYGLSSQACPPFTLPKIQSGVEYLFMVTTSDSSCWHTTSGNFLKDA